MKGKIKFLVDTHLVYLPTFRFILLQGTTGLGFAIGEGPSHLEGEQGICIKSITPGGVAEQVCYSSIIDFTKH